MYIDMYIHTYIHMSIYIHTNICSTADTDTYKQAVPGERRVIREDKDAGKGQGACPK